MTLNLDHFETALLFALVSSVVLGIVTKKTTDERWKYGLYCFMAALFGIGWFMRLLHG